MVAAAWGSVGQRGAARNRADLFPPVSRFQTLLNKAEQIVSGGQPEISISIATNVRG